MRLIVVLFVLGAGAGFSAFILKSIVVTELFAIVTLTLLLIALTRDPTQA